MTTQTDIVPVKTAIANAWRWHAAYRFFGINSHHSFSLRQRLLRRQRLSSQARPEIPGKLQHPNFLQ
jgi:hypothetical protein